MLKGAQMDAASSSSSSPAPKTQQVQMDAASSSSSSPAPKTQQVLLPLKPELLPSVLRTSADLAPGGKAATPGTAPKAAEGEHAKRGPGQSRITPADLLGTSLLPRVDAAHHQALPARPALSTAPNQSVHGIGATPERQRRKAGPVPFQEQQQPLQSRGHGRPAGIPAVAAAAAAARTASPGRAAAAAVPAGRPHATTCKASMQHAVSSSAWKALDVPAVGSMAMTTLPNAAAWLSGSPDARTTQAAAGAPAVQQQQQQQQQQPSAEAAAVLAARSGSPPADDLRLMRPVDPTNPAYYWKPQPGADGKVPAPAGSVIDRILGAQLLLDAGSAEGATDPVTHVRQRKSILLRMPLGAELFLSAVPAVIQDPAGHACLLVLPSDKPSNRKEAVAVEDLLAALLQDPDSSVTKACQWRASVLAALCADSLVVVAEAIKQRCSGQQQWQFRQLARNLTGKMLGSHMAEAVGSLVSSSHPNRTAAQLVQLLDSKDAVAQAGTAATEATLQAAVAVAPASVKPLKFPGGLTATEAAASLDGATTDTAAGVLSQQQSRASHSAASRALTPKSNRSSRSGSLSPTLRPKQHAQPEQQQQQQAVQGPGDGFFLSTSCPAGSPRCSLAAAAPEGTSRRSTDTLGTYASLTVITGAERAASSQGSAGSRCAGQAVSGGSPGSRQGSAAGTSSPSALASVFRPSLSPAVDGPLQQPQPGTEHQQQQQASPADSRSGTSSPARSSRLQTGSSRCSSPAPALAPGTPQGHAAAGSPHVSSGSRDGSPGALRNSGSIAGSAAQQPPGSARQGKPPGSPREAGGTSVSGGALPTSSRLSSATGQNSPAGRVQDQQLQLVAEQEELAPTGATGSNSSNSSNGDAEQQHGGQLSSLYGLSLSAAICMADLVRQVEVACVERGHALAYAWNCSMSAAEAVMVELRVQNSHLLGINSQLAAGQEELAKELKAVDFLRREALRFRRAMEEAQERLSQATDDNSRLKGELEAASTELEAVDAFANTRLARLRWRNAFAVLGTWSQQSIIQSGLTRADHGKVLPKVRMLEKLMQAVTAVEHCKASYGRGKAADQPETGISDVAQVMTAGPRMAAPPGRGQGASYSSDNSAQMLSVLTPEARTLVLAAMAPSQRWRVMEAMKDEERAEIIISMGLKLRKDAAAALDPKTWERTMDAVKNNGAFASRYLKAWDIEDASKEFLLWGTFQQVDCLTSLDAYTAAGILTRTPEALRKDLLGMLEPFVAANIVQVMLPPPAAAAMEGLDMKKAMAILIAMDPNKAADVLTEMGSSQAASKLILMEADARNSIIQSMAPRAAANTLTSMEDAMQAICAASEPGSPEMLSLNGGTSAKSPVMGAISDLDPNNAYTIMSYMRIKDKAALLAGMEPDAVARLLACMDPNEAVLLLSALGDGTSKLVSNFFTPEDRDRLVEVLQGADCKTANFSSRARLRGSFRNAAAPDTVGRLVGAYEAITADAMDADGDEESVKAEPPPKPAPSTRCTKDTSSNQHKERQQEAARGNRQQAAGELGGVPANLASTEAAASSNSAPGAGCATQRRVSATSSIGGMLPDEPSDTQSSDAEAEGVDKLSAATTSTAAADRPATKMAQTGAASKAHKPPVPAGPASKKTGAAGAGSAAVAGGARERRLSSRNAVNTEGTDTALAAAKPPAAAGAAAAASRKAGVAAGNPRRTRQSDAGVSVGGAAPEAAPSRRATGGGAAVGSPSVVPEDSSAVPGLRLRGRTTSSDDAGEEAGQDGLNRRMTHADAEHSTHSMPSSDQEGLSGNSTPCTGAGAGVTAAKATVHAAAPAAAAKGAAAGRKALKEALKSQAFAKKSSRAATATSTTAGAAAVSGGGAGAGAEGGRLGASAAAAAAEDDIDSLLGPSIGGGAGMGGVNSGPAEEAPQVKLGRVPRNARLIEAMAQHKNAKPKPKGWLMAVVDSIYKEGETLLRKLGRTDMLKKQSVPEIVFAYFHNKYGQRALVNENVGSLVNTLTLYQHTDLRLEAFARQLSEEWDVGIFVDFIIAQNLCLQPSKVACIEYPRDAGKDEQYPWVCLWKAVAVADSILGARAQAARKRFNEFMQMAALPADDADVERVRRERREAAAKDGVKLADADLPERFYKLPRIRFLLLLCKEMLRINRYIVTFGEDRFTAVDVQRSGKISVVAVRTFVKSMSPGVSDMQVSEHISMFLATAEAAVRDVAPEQMSVASITEVTREAFVAGVSGTQAVREHIKLHKLPPARLEEENEEAQIFCSLLGVLMARHSKALLPTWEEALDTAGQRASSALQQQLAVVAASNTATDVRFKAYVGLLLGLINVSVQGYVDGLLSSEAQVDTPNSDQLEEGLLRLEDVALILVHGCSYLLAEDSQELAAARTLRLPLGAQITALARQLLTHRRMRDGMVANAAAVLQRVWRARQRQGHRQLMREEDARQQAGEGLLLL